MTDEEYIERATTFDGYEAPATERPDGRRESLKSHYSRLSILNSLDYNGKWKDRERETIKNASAIVDAVAGQLQLTDYQKQESQRRFSALPNEINEAYSTSLVAFCVCGLVGFEDGRPYQPNKCHPQIEDKGKFARVADDIGLSYSAINTCWTTVRGEMQ